MPAVSNRLSHANGRWSFQRLARECIIASDSDNSIEPSFAAAIPAHANSQALAVRFARARVNRSLLLPNGRTRARLARDRSSSNVSSPTSADCTGLRTRRYLGGLSA
jgi:hypothetical protein